MNYLKKVIYERYRTHFLKIESVAAFSLLECSDPNNPSADHKELNDIYDIIKSIKPGSKPDESIIKKMQDFNNKIRDIVEGYDHSSILSPTVILINRIIEDIKIKAKNLLIYHSDVDLSAIFEVLTLEDIQKLNLFLQIDDLDKGFKDKILAFMGKKEISKKTKKQTSTERVNEQKQPEKSDQNTIIKNNDNNKQSNLNKYVPLPLIMSTIDFIEKIFTSISLRFSQTYEFISARVSQIKSGVKYLLNSVLNFFNR